MINYSNIIIILQLIELYEMEQLFRKDWKISCQIVWMRRLFAMKSLHLPEHE